MSYEKLTSSSPESQSESPVADHVNALASLFPSVVREGKVDFDALRQMLGDDVAKDDELFGLQWKGKAQARRAATTPSLGTLRPCKEESVDWETTKNLYIEGDNLEVLKLLRKSYAGKVKMIYIDPPYNTGKEFVYPDNYQNGIEEYKKLTGQLGCFKANAETSGRFHTDWLNMMYPRLVLAKDLLSDDGVIFISIDDNELYNLKDLCDEILGESNFIANIIRNTNSSKNQSLFVSVSHEYCLVYAKNILFLKTKHVENKWCVSKNNTDEYIKIVKRLKKEGLDSEHITMELKTLTKYPRFIDFTNYWYFDSRGLYRKGDLGGVNNGNMTPLFNPKTNAYDPVPPGGFRYSVEKLQKLAKENRIHFHTDGSLPTIKRYLHENREQRPKSIMSDDQRPDVNLLASLNIYFENPKQLSFMKRLISIVDKDSIIVDFFSGSSTTAHAVMSLNAEDGGNRKFIMVQLPEPCDEKSDALKAGFETISDIGKVRIRRAGKKIKEEAGLQGHHLDIGFRVYKLDSSNLRVWNPEVDDLELALGSHEKHLLPGRTQEDLLYEILLKQGIELTEDARVRDFEGKHVYSLGHGQYYACMETVISSEQIESLALGIVQWKNEESPDNTQCAVFVIDEAFRSDADKLNFAKILEQHGIPSVKAL